MTKNDGTYKEPHMKIIKRKNLVVKDIFTFLSRGKLIDAPLYHFIIAKLSKTFGDMDKINVERNRNGDTNAALSDTLWRVDINLRQT